MVLPSGYDPLFPDYQSRVLPIKLRKYIWWRMKELNFPLMFMKHL